MKNSLEEDVIESLRKNGEMTRTELMTALHVPWTTVYDCLIRLMEKGIITNRKIIYGRGRPLVMWFIGVKEENSDERKKIRLLKEIQKVLHIPTQEILWMEIEETIDKLKGEIKHVGR